jgi:hypothetical protein
MLRQSFLLKKNIIHGSTTTLILMVWEGPKSDIVNVACQQSETPMHFLYDKNTTI